jgi:hypothetical protein
MLQYGRGSGSRFQADAAVSAVFLEYPPKDHALVDPIRLETVLGDITHTTDGLLEYPKVELPLPADVVLKDVRYGDKRIFSCGEEDLGRSAIKFISTAW